MMDIKAPPRTRSPITPDQIMADLRRCIEEARTELVEQVADACPGAHRVVQHRDMRSPWCEACCRYADGRHVNPNDGHPSDFPTPYKGRIG